MMAVIITTACALAVRYSGTRGGRHFGCCEWAIVSLGGYEIGGVMHVMPAMHAIPVMCVACLLGKGL